MANGKELVLFCDTRKGSFELWAGDVYMGTTMFARCMVVVRGEYFAEF